MSRARPGERLGVLLLVIVGSERIWNEYRRLACRSQFGDSARTRPAHDDIRLPERARHVLNERDHFAVDSCAGEARGNLLVLAHPGLVNEPNTERGAAEERPTLRSGAVQCPRALAPAGDQDSHRATSFFVGDFEELAANGQS